MAPNSIKFHALVHNNSHKATHTKFQKKINKSNIRGKDLCISAYENTLMEEHRRLKKTNLGIKPKTSHIIPVVQIVRREMLTASRGLEMATHLQLPSFIWITLNPPDIRHRIFCSHQWVFSGSLLPSPPSWVPENVYVWCPKCHPRRLSCIVHCSRFDSDHLTEPCTRYIHYKSH